MKSESEVALEYLILTNRILDFKGYRIYFEGNYFELESPIGIVSTKFNTIREVHCFFSGIEHQKMVLALDKP